MGLHKTAAFFHRGTRKLILCDSPDGSSALTALYNCLSLSHLEYREQTQIPYMEESHMKGFLLRLVANNVALLVSNGDESSACLIEKKPDCERLINDCNHNSNIELSPCLEGIGSFLESDFYWLSVLVGAKLLHGWVASPTEHKRVYDVVKLLTFDDLEVHLSLLMDMKARETDLDEVAVLAHECELVQDLLNAANKQWTSEGYTLLCNELKDGEFAICYWNKRFSVVHKIGNDLLILETNPNVLSLSSKITWRVFGEVEGQSSYLTSDYLPVVNQLNIGKEVLFRGRVEASNNEQHSNEIEKAEEAKNETLTKSQRKRLKDKLRKQSKKEKLSKSQEDGSGATVDGQTSGLEANHLGEGQQLKSPGDTSGKEASELAMQQLEKEHQGGGSSSKQTDVDKDGGKVGGSSNEQTGRDGVRDGTQLTRTHQEDGAGATIDGRISGQPGKHPAAGQQLQSPENTSGKEASESAMQQLEEEDQGGGSSNEQIVRDEVGDGPQMTRTQKRRKDRKDKKLLETQQVENAKEDKDVPEKSVQQTYEDVERKAEKEEHADDASDKHGKTTEENEGESSSLPQEEERPESEIYNDFEHFLLRFKDGGSDVSYFLGVAEALKYTGSPRFFVSYDFIKQHDKTLALRIQDNYPRVREDLTRCVRSFLSKCRVSIADAAELIIQHLPQPKSVQSFTDFADSNGWLVEYDVFGDATESPSYFGRSMSLGYMDVLIEKFKEGKCFGGRWGIEDMAVANGGSSFIIDCEDEVLTADKGLLDLQQWDVIVLSRFKTKNGTFPSFFEELRSDFQMIHECFQDQNKWERFLMLIRYPFALKAPLVRSAFICNVYRAADSVSSGNYTPLHCRRDDWRDNAINHKLLKEVYDYQNFNNGPSTFTYTVTKWAASYWALLKFCRHFIEHVLDYYKKGNVGQQIQFQDIIIVDLLMSIHLGKFIGRLISHLILYCDIDGLFWSAWAHFMGSNCIDKPPQSICVTNVAGSSVSSWKSVGHDIGWALTEIRSSGTSVANSAVGSKGLQKSIVIGDLDLQGFVKHLTGLGLPVTIEHNSLVCRTIRVYKAWNKKKVPGGFVSDMDSDPVITVEGPVCDNYYMIFDELSLWLRM